MSANHKRLSAHGDPLWEAFEQLRKLEPRRTDTTVVVFGFKDHDLRAIAFSDWPTTEHDAGRSLYEDVDENENGSLGCTGFCRDEHILGLCSKLQDEEHEESDYCLGWYAS